MGVESEVSFRPVLYEESFDFPVCRKKSPFYAASSAPRMPVWISSILDASVELIEGSGSIVFPAAGGIDIGSVIDKQCAYIVIGAPHGPVERCSPVSSSLGVHIGTSGNKSSASLLVAEFCCIVEGGMAKTVSGQWQKALINH